MFQASRVSQAVFLSLSLSLSLAIGCLRHIVSGIRMSQDVAELRSLKHIACETSQGLV